MAVNVESLINCVQNEPCLWNTTLNSTEEEKELAWLKICELLGCQTGLFNDICYIKGRDAYWLS
jgi:hypothetical protein